MFSSWTKLKGKERKKSVIFTILTSQHVPVLKINQNIQAKQNHINLLKARSSPNKYGIFEDIPSHVLFDHAFF